MLTVSLSNSNWIHDEEGLRVNTDFNWTCAVFPAKKAVQHCRLEGFSRSNTLGKAPINGNIWIF